PEPGVAGPAVVTGDGGTVTGRDPITGKELWHYSRDLPLCEVVAQSPSTSSVIAVHARTNNLLPDNNPRKAGGCSEVSMFNGGSGKLEAQRNSDAELGTRLLADGSSDVITTGRSLVTAWRSDLVLTVAYGTVPALVNAGKQPKHTDGNDCT